MRITAVSGTDKRRFRRDVCSLAAVGQSSAFHHAHYFKNSLLASSICEMDAFSRLDFLQPIGGDRQRHISTLWHKAAPVGGREPNPSRSCNSPKIVTFWTPHRHLWSRLDFSCAKFWSGEIH